MSPSPDLLRMSIAPVPRDGVSRPRQIAVRLREQFLAGSLRPGDRVPSERELARTLHVSRAALREGLRILETEGLLKIVHGRGAYVVGVPVRAPLTRTAATAPTAISKEIVDLMNVRRILEPEAAALAARHIRRPEVAALRRICERAQALLSREHPPIDRLTELNRKFHLAISGACGNAMIKRVVAGMLAVQVEDRHLFRERLERHRKSWCDDGEHLLIVQAIVAGEAEAARAFMAAHLRYD